MGQDGLIRQARTVIDVTPTLHTGEYASGDIMFNRAEIPNAVIEKGGCSKLLNVTYNSKKADDHSYLVHLITNNQSVGSANDACNISAADGAAAGFLGSVTLSNDHDLGNFATGGATKTGGFDSLNFLLQAASDSTSIYFFVTTTSVATYAADDLTFRFHIEY